jgi:hypothetical protein
MSFSVLVSKDVGDQTIFFPVLLVMPSSCLPGVVSEKKVLSMVMKLLEMNERISREEVLI